MEKRLSHGWQSGAYGYPGPYGLQASSGGAPEIRRPVRLRRRFRPPTFGRDPNNLTNAYGRLPNDRPHMLRVMGTFDVPRTG